MIHPARQRKDYVVDRLSGKKSKNEVNFRPANHEDTESCAECTHYSDPGEPEAGCELVAGVIRGMDMCDLFKRGEGAQVGNDGVNIEINIGR